MPVPKITGDSAGFAGVSKSRPAAAFCVDKAGFFIKTLKKGKGAPPGSYAHFYPQWRKPKNAAITASQIQRAVNNEIMMDGSSIKGFVRIEESDQYLWPAGLL